MNESGDDQLVATAQTKLTELRTRLSMYLVDSSKITTAKGLPAVQASDTAITSGMLASNLVNAVIIDNRLGGFVGNGGIASGDIFQKYGAWVKGTYTNGQQKTFKLEPGYKFDQKGVTIGADTGDDESTIGIAYSFFKNDIKNKINSSNKEDITSHIWSIYGLYAFDQNFFISGHGQCGFSTTKKKRATGDAANNIANAKPKGNIISGKATIGYIYDTGANINLIPTLGIAYNDVKVKGYKETGNGLNRTVGKRSATRTSGLAGISAKYNADMNESTKIVPEIHANIDYAFNTKHSSTAITILNGLDPIVTPAAKLSKAHYTVGASVMVTSSEKFDITGGYDLGLSKKFMSHTGTVKVRINF